MELNDLLRTQLPRRRLRALLEALPRVTVGVVGDFFLDAYFDCDRALDEPSLETGRNCYQVVRCRRQAGAAGTVAANLRALGVGRVPAVGFCGDDGEGYELRRAMARLGLDLGGFLTCPERCTPMYGKPTYVERRGRRLRVVEELERLDIKNRRRTPAWVEAAIVDHVQAHAPGWQGAIVLDQVSEAGCGAITPRVRELVNGWLAARPGLVVLADSRERLGLFRHVILKPNQREAARLGRPAAAGGLGASAASGAQQRQSAADSLVPWRTLARTLAERSGRPVFLTMGAGGLIAAADGRADHVPAVPVPAPVDPVGAGDTTSAAAVAVLAAGGTVIEAALVAVLAASITVQQLGTTGTASPAQVLRRHQELLHDR